MKNSHQQRIVGSGGGENRHKLPFLWIFLRTFICNLRTYICMQQPSRLQWEKKNTRTKSLLQKEDEILDFTSTMSIVCLTHVKIEMDWATQSLKTSVLVGKFQNQMSSNQAQTWCLSSSVFETDIKLMWN